MGFPLRESALTKFTFEQMQLTKSSTQVLLLINQLHPHRASLAEKPWKHIIGTVQGFSSCDDKLSASKAFDLISKKLTQ
jgi:hypothetical protein